MANMSYCRFENTYRDLQDCYDALGEKSLDELSETEKKYAKNLIKMCRDIADDFLDDEAVLKLTHNGKVYKHK